MRSAAGSSGADIGGSHLFISYATEDAALAEWLALRLTAEGYRVWIDRFELLGGEPFPHDIDAAIKTKTFRLLQLVSRHSLDKPNPTKERTLALNLGRTRGIDFLIPLNVDGIPAAELNWMLSDLTYVPFCPSWARGLSQMLKKLRKVDTPRFEGDGRAIAASQFLPDDVLTSEPEVLYSNLVPVSQSPELIHRFRWNRHLSAPEKQALDDAWPNCATERQDGLHRRIYSYAFEPPPTALLENLPFDGRRPYHGVMPNKSRSLGEFEQLVLLAVARLGEEAYGAPVWDEIVERTGRDVTLGTVHKTLMRLEDKGLLKSRMGEPTPRRGGRRKRLYELSPSGRHALERTLGVLWRMAEGLGLATEAP